MALQEFIRLAPEPDAEVPPEQADELEEMEREYQEMV